MKPFSIDLATIPAGRSDSLVEARPDEIGLDPAQWGERVRGRLTVEKSGDQVTVRGHLEAEALQECVLCLAPARLDLRVPFEVFAERTGGRRKAEEAELERDDYMLFHDGRQLELAEEAREALLLEVPIAPKCRPDCRGLCPRCGADLNQGPCGCVSRADEPPEAPTG
jgi:uncharacterized protein